mmetsp:Transcript_19065/g.58737  ORF Transcript_19065/g.58737 Transcript_19065/m.58737 type:complete len:217 (+) Transcript_19065:107-757(+)
MAPANGAAPEGRVGETAARTRGRAEARAVGGAGVRVNGRQGPAGAGGVERHGAGQAGAAVVYGCERGPCARDGDRETRRRKIVRPEDCHVEFGPGAHSRQRDAHRPRSARLRRPPRGPRRQAIDFASGGLRQLQRHGRRLGGGGDRLFERDGRDQGGELAAGGDRRGFRQGRAALYVGGSERDFGRQRQQSRPALVHVLRRSGARLRQLDRAVRIR